MTLRMRPDEDDREATAPEAWPVSGARAGVELPELARPEKTGSRGLTLMVPPFSSVDNFHVDSDEVISAVGHCLANFVRYDIRLLRTIPGWMTNSIFLTISKTIKNPAGCNRPAITNTGE